jgi:bifunctional non-homologous end joining protein LigD
MTLAFRKKEREGRVFVDWLRNAPYSTSVVPWSLRARPQAPVAAPLVWDEIDEVDPNGVHMSEVSGRLELDPWHGNDAQDLVGTARKVESALEDADITLGPFDRFRS